MGPPRGPKSRAPKVTPAKGHSYASATLAPRTHPSSAPGKDGGGGLGKRLLREKVEEEEDSLDRHDPGQ
eukprot:170025-Pyramimonas_sp.AAC.1